MAILISVLRRIQAFPAGRWGKWIVLVIWIGIAMAAGPIGGKLQGAVKNDQSSYLPSDAESTKALNLINQFPSGETLPTLVIAERSGTITPHDIVAMTTYMQQINKQVTVLKGLASPPQVSQDGHALMIFVPLRGGLDGKPVQDAVQTIRNIITHPPTGLTVKAGGIGAVSADEFAAFGSIDGTLLIATLVVVVLILLATYRSPTLWLVPLISVGMAYTLAQALVYEMSQHTSVVVSGETTGILTVLVFGAGTDYALLLIARYREELTRHRDRHEAMTLALHRAVPAVLASSSTVVLGLLCLLTASLASIRGLGPVGGAGIVCAFLALVTLLPALLTIFGRGLYWPFVPHEGKTADQLNSFWGRVGQRVMRNPRPVWIAATAVLLLVATGTFTLKSGLTNDQAFRNPPDSVAADALIAAHFPAGVSNPADVIATASTTNAALAATKNTPGVVSARVTETANNLVRIQSTLQAENGTPAAFSTVDALRNNVHSIPGANALVGGESAIEHDVADAGVHDRNIAMPLILVVVLIVLMLLLRAIIAPVLLMISVVVSYLAALGASAFLFNHVFSFAGSDQTLPLLGYVFLVALGVDYNIFLMSRVREETVTRGTRQGMLIGLATTGGVITSAGFVLAATFSALAILPLVFLTEIGVLVALGVLLDTLVVRSVIVPALVEDVGSFVWWPSRLRHDPDPETEVRGTAQREKVSTEAQ